MTTASPSPSLPSPLRRTTPFVYGTLSSVALLFWRGPHLFSRSIHSESMFSMLALMIAGSMFVHACGSYAELRGRTWLSGAAPSFATMLFALFVYAIR